MNNIEKCELLAMLSHANDTTGAANALSGGGNISCNASNGSGVLAPDIMDDVTHGGLALLDTNYLLAVVYCCIVSAALFLGVFGNIIIVLVSTTTTAMNKIGKHFVVNLALADLCVASVSDPMCILGVLKGERWFRDKWLLCEVVAGMCLTACFCAFLGLLMMTVNRYVFVCHHRAYFKIYRRSVCLVLCAACWITAFVFEFPNVIGWGDHYFDEKSHQCIWDRTASLSYTLTVTIGLIGGPLLAMFACFVLIFWKIYQTKKEVFVLNTDDPMRLKRIWIESLRTSRTLVVIFIAFVICWTPYAVVTAIDVNNTFSVELHLLVTLLAHLHSSLNFTVYMALNKSFRQSVIKTFTFNSLSRKTRNSLDSASASNSQNSSDTTRSDITAIRNKVCDEIWKGEFKPAVKNCEVVLGIRDSPVSHGKRDAAFRD